MTDDYYLHRSRQLLTLTERYVTGVVAIGRDDPRHWRVTALEVLPAMRRLADELKSTLSSNQDPPAGGAS